VSERGAAGSVPFDGVPGGSWLTCPEGSPWDEVVLPVELEVVVAVLVVVLGWAVLDDEAGVVAVELELLEEPHPNNGAQTTNQARIARRERRPWTLAVISIACRSPVPVPTG